MQDSSRGLLPFYSHLITATPSVTPAFESQGTGPPVPQLLSSEGHGRGGGAGGERGEWKNPGHPPSACSSCPPHGTSAPSSRRSRNRAPRASHEVPGDSVWDEPTRGLERTAEQGNSASGTSPALPRFGRAPSRLGRPQLRDAFSLYSPWDIRRSEDAHPKPRGHDAVEELPRVAGSTPIRVFRHACNSLEPTHQT